MKKLNFECLNNLVCEGDRVIVGVSGGADSMCLIDLVLKFSKKTNFKFTAVHINHGIRDEEALRDQNFVKEYCLKNDINFIEKRINAVEFSKKEGKTLEQAARELRYKVFEDILKELNANKILVAHHKNDQAETVLMHILRGSSIHGAKGMSQTNKNIVRPLLNYSREDILEYNKQNNIKYVDDSTNFDDNYVRNYIRLKIIPALEKVYPNAVNSLCEFAEKCSADDEFINSLIPKDCLTIKNGKAYLKEEIKNCDKVIALRIIRSAFEKLNAIVDVNSVNFEQVLKLFSKKNGSSINLPNSLKAYKEYNQVVISKEDELIIKQAEFKIGQTQILNKVITVENADLNNVKFVKGENYVDLDKIPKDAIWRIRREGDIFKKFSSGTKKLGDYLTDCKIPLRLRNALPVLAINNEVLVILGVEISNSVKIDESTKNIVKISYKKD